MSIKNRSRLPFATLAVVLATVPLWGQEPQKQRLEIEIEKVAPAKYGYEVSIRLKNVSATAVKLARTGGAASPMLQSLDVQQWDEKLGWQSVGPCRDVPPRTMITISPQQQLEDVVPIGDLEHGWPSSVCPRKIRRLGGKIRAVVYCMYKSEQEYHNRMRCRDCCTPNVSSDFNLQRSQGE